MPDRHEASYESKTNHGKERLEFLTLLTAAPCYCFFSTTVHPAKCQKMPTLLIVIQNNMCYRSGIMSSNEKTISFRAVAEKIEALDSLAAAQERSRSYLINEAIANYIELHAYQDALVRKGLEEMRKGRVVSHEQVLKGLKRTGRARQ